MSINQDLYRSLKTVLLASGQFETVVNIFVANSEERLKNLRLAFETQDRANIKQIAHSIKGSCSMLGGITCADICQAIENASKDESREVSITLLTQLREEIDSLKAFLIADLSGSTPDCCE